MNLRVDFKPSKEVFEILIKALDKYKFAHGTLQLHDKARITKSFDKSCFAVLFEDEIPIGFSTWQRYGNVAEIQYKWLLPSYRGKGIGKKFGLMFNKGLLHRKIYLLVAEPATDYGNGMARTLEYRRLDEAPYRFQTKFWYRFNKEGRKPLESSKGEGYELRLWKNERDQYYGNEPIECYSLDERLDRKPILTMSDTDTTFQLVKDNKVIKQDRMKYFFTEKELQDFGFLYISTPLTKFLKKHDLLAK